MTQAYDPAPEWAQEDRINQRAAERRDQAAGWLRAIAEVVETADMLTGNWSMSVPGYYHAGPHNDVKADLARWVRAMKSRGAKVTKRANDVSFAVDAVFPADSPLRTFTAFASRDAVCERVVTGTREVTETVPDPELIADVPLVEVTTTVEDVEWICAPLLGES